MHRFYTYGVTLLVGINESSFSSINQRFTSTLAIRFLIVLAELRSKVTSLWVDKRFTHTLRFMCGLFNA